MLRDSSIYYLNVIVLDIDDKYDDIIDEVYEFIKLFNIKKYIIERTKSGRLRLYIPIEPILAYKYHNNNHKNIDNFRELVGIYISYFQKKGINIDIQNFYKINQPIWLPEFPYKDAGGFIQISHITEIGNYIENRNLFYNLYKNAKIIQKELKLYYIKVNNKRSINLTEYFWKEKIGAKSTTNSDTYNNINNIYNNKIKIPPFILRYFNNINNENGNDRYINDVKERYIQKRYEKAIETLSIKHKSFRFIHIFLPALGWAKYLGLDEDYIYHVLKTYVPDKNNFDRDFTIALRKAKPIEFHIPKSSSSPSGNRRSFIERLKNMSYKDVYERVLKYLKENKEVWRKDIIALCYNQRWLTDAILKDLHKKGLVEFEFIRNGKRGRPKKLIRYIGKDDRKNLDYKYNNLAKAKKPLPAFSVSEAYTKELDKLIKELPQHLWEELNTYVHGYEFITKIYEYLSQLDKPITIQEISNRLQISKTSIRYLLKVLKERGIIDYIRKGKRGIQITAIKWYSIISLMVYDFINSYYHYRYEIEEYFKLMEKIMELKEVSEDEGRDKRKKKGRAPPRNRRPKDDNIDICDIDF